MLYLLRVFALKMMGIVIIVWVGVGCHSKSVSPSPEPMMDSAIAEPVSIISKNTLSKSLKKPGASVSIKNIQPIRFFAAGVQSVELLLSGSSYPGTMNVSVSASEDVTLIDQSVFQFELTHGGEYKLPLTFSVEQNGRYYLRLHVEVVVGELIERRVISAILQVGETVQRIKKTQGESTDAVLTLPAEETVLAQ